MEDELYHAKGHTDRQTDRQKTGLKNLGDYRGICIFLLCLCILIFMFMYSYCYVYVFLLLWMLCSVHSVFIVPTGTLRLPWLRVFLAISSVVMQMPGYNSQRRGRVRTIPKLIGCSVYCLCVNVYCTVLYCTVLYYCHQVSTQLQLTKISIYIYPGDLITSFYEK